MTPIRDNIILKKRFRELKKRQRFLKQVERNRRRRVFMLRLHQRLQLDVHSHIKKQGERRMEAKKKRIAKQETAKLNRTLKRRRRR